MNKIYIIIFVFIYNMSFAQVPSISWQKCIGGTGEDRAFSIHPTTDKGYIVAGFSESNDGDVTFNHGRRDCWVVKTSAIGNIQWQKAYGGSQDDVAYDIQQTSDGGYIVAGHSYSNDGDVIGNHGDWDWWILKLDNAGSIQWQKALGGTQEDKAYAVRQTTDGSYIVLGISMSNDGDVLENHGFEDYWLVKLSNSGNLLWQKSFGGGGADKGFSVKQTTDGGYIVAGRNAAEDIWIIKLNDTGAIHWQKTLGGSGYEAAHDIQQTYDGGYVVAGYSTSKNGDVTINNGSNDYWIVKLSPSGSMQWQKSFGGKFSDYALSIQQTSDSGYIVTGVSTSMTGDIPGHHGSDDCWVIKTDSLGNMQWQKAMGGTMNEHSYSIKKTTDDGYILAGWTNSNNGDIVGNHGVTADFWIVKLGGTTFVSTVNKPLVSIFPNPTTGNIIVNGVDNVTVRAYNIVGILIKEVSNTDNISLAEFPTGMYFIQLFNEQSEMILADKIIKQ